MPWEHSYAHFCSDKRKGLEDVIVKIIGKTDATKPVVQKVLGV